jgi:hypothetical protein
MKNSYRIIEVSDGNNKHFLVQKRYLLLFWRTSKHFRECEEENSLEYDIAFRDLEEAFDYLNRLKLVDNRTHKIVYSDDNFL